MTDTQGKILLVEDEKSLSDVVKLNLELEGYSVDCIERGDKALQHASKVHAYDLIILDVMLPEVSGWEICKAYKSTSDTPILFMSAKGNSSDKIKGLKLGADDYLGKPFDLEELLLRVQILIQRNNGSVSHKKEQINIGEFEINLLTYNVIKDDRFITELTKREVELLELFYKHEGEVVSRDFILDQLWSKDYTPTARTIDNYILSFRKLFEADPKNPAFFHSIRGVGYKFINK